MTRLERPFVSVHSRSALEREIEMAEELLSSGRPAFLPDDTAEEGYIAALRFVLNNTASSVREVYDELMQAPENTH